MVRTFLFQFMSIIADSLVDFLQENPRFLKAILPLRTKVEHPRVVI